MANLAENFMSRISQALSKPIQNRCAELTVLFDKGNIKDLQNVFPVVVDNIFGPQSSFCWELRSITQSKNFQDFRTLQHFLSPHGAMFRLIYMLLRDPQIKYDFNLTYLPTKVRQNLDTATSYPFYAEILNVNPQNKQPISLLLNPFDYYFFHFAYHLINPWHQRMGSSSGMTFGSGTVYFNLCCDYILHFLPTNPECPVLPIINYYVGKNSIQTLPIFVRPPRVSKLLRPNVLADALNEFNAIHQTMEQHPRTQIWRSETVLIVFVDMWLNNDQVIQNDQNFLSDKFQQGFQFNNLPTSEYIRAIRVLVKHLHAFSSSAKFDDTYMNELKKSAIPYMQGKMYIFLRNLVHRWPLDGSFRLILELWLSFIQPWRYIGNENQSEKGNNAEMEDNVGATSTKAVDREYLPFIVENFLAYIVIFQQLLPRFTKIDLSSPKNALMLYRMLKVFGQPNLMNLLKEAEACLENLNNSPTHVRWSSDVPPLSPTSSWCSSNIGTNNSAIHNTMKDSTSDHYIYLSSSLNSNSSSAVTARLPNDKWSNIVKQKIYEFEGPNFCYRPLLTVEPAQEVYDLLWHIKKSQHAANALIKLRKDEESKNCRGFFGLLRYLFMQSDYSNDEFSLDERSKVPVYLTMCFEYLIEIFQINKSHLQNCYREEKANQELSAQINKDDFPFLLTPERVRERMKKIKYEGNPDLHPIRSDESTFLVRILYNLSTKLNEQFGHYIRRLYYEENFWGKVCREIVSPPMTVYRYDKSHFGHSPRICEHLPPRVSLRPLASYKFLSYLIIIAAVFNMFGVGPFAFAFVMTFLWITIVLWKVLFRAKPIENRDFPRRQLNLSLSDSFN